MRHRQASAAVARKMWTAKPSRLNNLDISLDSLITLGNDIKSPVQRSERGHLRPTGPVLKTGHLRFLVSNSERDPMVYHHPSLILSYLSHNKCR